MTFALVCGTIHISIHAPAKGATGFRQLIADIGFISIHAPAKGATFVAREAGPELVDFNPRSREGSDDKSGIVTAVSSDFNPRSREGSDSTERASLSMSFYFNPRSREGSDKKAISLDVGKTQFQSTLPRRERR